MADTKSTWPELVGKVGTCTIVGGLAKSGPFIGKI